MLAGGSSWPARATARLLCIMSAASTDDSPNKVSANPLPTAEYFAEYGQLYDHVGML